MKELLLKISVSVDGFMAGPGGEIDWFFASMGDDVITWIADTLEGAGVHAMGSRTYQDMAAYWPNSSGRLAAAMNRIPKVVFSQRPDVTAHAEGNPDAAALASWTHPRLAHGALRAEIDQLKHEPGEYILAHGGVSFAGSLIAAGLVDELRLVVHPVMLGKGLSPFGAIDSPLELSLCSSTRFRSGVVANVYRPTGRTRPSAAD